MSKHNLWATKQHFWKQQLNGEKLAVGQDAYLFWVQLFYCFILFLTGHHINTLWKCWVPVPVVTSSRAETRFWWKCECTLSLTSNRNAEFLCLCYLVHSRNQVLVKGQAVGQTAADGGQHWQHSAHNLVGLWEKVSRKFKGDQKILALKPPSTELWSVIFLCK